MCRFRYLYSFYDVEFIDGKGDLMKLVSVIFERAPIRKREACFDEIVKTDDEFCSGNQARVRAMKGYVSTA